MIEYTPYYRPKNFILQELVHPDIHKERGERAWELLQAAALISLDQLHAKFGTMIINTWHSPTLQKKYGLRKESGARLFTTSTGAKWSQHKFFNGFDVLFANHTAEDVRKYVLSNPKEFPFITAIESKVNWFHFDCRNVKPITVFNP